MNTQEVFIVQATISECSFNQEHEPTSHSYEIVFQTCKIVHFTSSMFPLYLSMMLRYNNNSTIW